MPTTLSSASSESISSRKLRVSTAAEPAGEHKTRGGAMDHGYDSSSSEEDNEEKEWHEKDGECEGSAKMAIDCEVSTSSSSSSLSSRLILLQYPSSTSSHPSSYPYTDSNSQSAQQLVLLPPVPSDVVRVQTPLLFPVTVVPQQVPRATEIQLFLSRIEYIEINSVVEREEGVIYYVLDVFRHRQQNGIPTRRRSSAPLPYQPQQQQHTAVVDVNHIQHNKHNNIQQLQRSGSSQSREPDYQIEHRYSSFARLRSNVWQIARKRHRRGRPCAYCGSLVKFFVESDAQPNLKVKFTTTTEKRKEILGKFINDLLFAIRDDHVECARSLRGYHQVPVLMKRFLNEQTGENFFS